MTVVAFDSKRFRRVKRSVRQSNEASDKKDIVFSSQLGVGVVISKPDEFTKRYIDTSRRLQKSFGLDTSLPFLSSSIVRQSVGIAKATSFIDQLLTSVSPLIDSIHCSYVILPPSRVQLVSVGGYGCPVDRVSPGLFVENLGPMFSYLTAHSYLWMKRYKNISELEIHIDAFRSKHTKAWKMITQALSPKIFLKGDECNPFISCADMVAFLTDAKLYNRHLKLRPNDIKEIWKDYFDITIQFFDPSNLNYYTWCNDDPIDFSKYLTRPIVFLAVDEIESDDYGVDSEDRVDLDSNKPRKFSRVIKQGDVYHAALRYAFHKGGCVKIFRRSEDMPLVKDGDVFAYVGTSSKSVGTSLRHACNIELLSGLELRKMADTLAIP